MLDWSDRPFLQRYRYHPVTHVNFRDATAFCDWKGGRLLTNDEWEAAARGETGAMYAHGDRLEVSRCNVAETGWARTTAVDAYPAGASPTGCLDMAGNVQEWTVPTAGGDYLVRGGNYMESGALYALTFLTIRADPEVKTPHLGFRYALK